MKSLLIAALIATGAGLVVSPADAVAPTTTVFGRGPEVHLSPSFGPTGTRVTVVGLGYRPGTQIKIMFGYPNAEFVAQIARARVGTQGRFHTTFMVTSSMGKPVTAKGFVYSRGVLIGAFNSNQSSITAYLITSA